MQKSQSTSKSVEKPANTEPEVPQQRESSTEPSEIESLNSVASKKEVEVVQAVLIVNVIQCFARNISSRPKKVRVEFSPKDR